MKTIEEFKLVLTLKMIYYQASKTLSYKNHDY